jgi:peptidoglycan/xylan/chitin deacetylase (PgdA/CDA1 family)
MRRLRSTILTYHSIDESGSVISISAELFRRQMARLAECGARVVPLKEIRRSPGAVAITFDDAYRNFLEHALPVLLEYRLPATLFVVSGRAGAVNDWSQKGYQGIPRLALMDWSELAEVVAAGVELGGHGATHADLTELGPEQARAELRRCREEIADRTGLPPACFAYPYGSTSDVVRRLAAEYYQAACGARLRYVEPNDDPFDLPRLDAYYLKNLSSFERAIQGRAGARLALRRTLRRLRRIL